MPDDWCLREDGKALAIVARVCPALWEGLGTFSGVLWDIHPHHPMKSPQNFSHPYNPQADVDASSRSPQIHIKRQSGPCRMLAAYPWQCCGHLVLRFVTLQGRVLFVTAGPSIVPVSSVSRATSMCSLVPMLRTLSLFLGFLLVTQIASQGHCGTVRNTSVKYACSSHLEFLQLPLQLPPCPMGYRSLRTQRTQP